MDEGVIVGQTQIPYYMWENEIDLSRKIRAEIPLLLTFITDYCNGSTENVIENCEGYYFPRVSKDDATINIEKDNPDVIFNKVRAEAKFGGAILNIDNKVFRLSRILFKNMSIPTSYEIREKEIIIQYRENIVIVGSEFSEETEM